MLSESLKVDASSKKSFIIVNHGLPIDPDYNILTESKGAVDAKCAWKPGKMELKNTTFHTIWRIKADHCVLSTKLQAKLSQLIKSESTFG